MEIVLPFSHPIWDATWPPALQTKRQQWWDELGRWIWHAGRWTLKRPANRLQPWTVLTPDEEYALEHWEALRIPPARTICVTVYPRHRALSNLYRNGMAARVEVPRHFSRCGI